MLSSENLKNAYIALKESYKDYLDNPESRFLQYISDSCVKRYEYTLETAWKLAKKIFIQKYGKTEEELTMNNIFRYMEGYGYAPDWENWKKYYQKRNDTAHEYDFVKSRTLIYLIPEFLKDVEYFLNKLKKDNND